MSETDEVLETGRRRFEVYRRERQWPGIALTDEEIEALTGRTSSWPAPDPSERRWPVWLRFTGGWSFVETSELDRLPVGSWIDSRWGGLFR